VLRIREGGEVVERIATEQDAIACMLGGAEGTTLFVCTAETTDPELCRQNRTARLLSIQVDVPGAGRP
jgi:sugar lactone lactonase YvrE